MELERLFLAWLLVLACICCTLSAPIAADVDESESSGSGSGESEGSGSKKEDIASSADGEQEGSAYEASGKEIPALNEAKDVKENKNANAGPALSSPPKDTKQTPMIKPSKDLGTELKFKESEGDDKEQKIASPKGIEVLANTDAAFIKSEKICKRCGHGCGCQCCGEHHHGECHDEKCCHCDHGHHEHEHEHHHHGHHHGFIHEWGQEEGGQHHGHEGKGHHCCEHEQCHDHECEDEHCHHEKKEHEDDCCCRHHVQKHKHHFNKHQHRHTKNVKATKKQTVHIGYGYASGDNYRLGYLQDGMGALSPVTQFAPRQLAPRRFSVEKRNNMHPPNYRMNYMATATPYGHPVTHPGFTTMAFGGAIASTEVRRRSNIARSLPSFFYKPMLVMVPLAPF